MRCVPRWRRRELPIYLRARRSRHSLPPPQIVGQLCSNSLDLLSGDVILKPKRLRKKTPDLSGILAGSPRLRAGSSCCHALLRFRTLSRPSPSSVANLISPKFSTDCSRNCDFNSSSVIISLCRFCGIILPSRMSFRLGGRAVSPGSAMRANRENTPTQRS